MQKVKVLVDTREQCPWKFTENSWCSGSEITTLKTGDYTLEGFEDKLCVEKKKRKRIL